MLYIAGGSDFVSPWASAELTGNFAIGDVAGVRRGVVAFRMNDSPYRPKVKPCRNSDGLKAGCPMTALRNLITAAHFKSMPGHSEA